MLAPNLFLSVGEINLSFPPLQVTKEEAKFKEGELLRCHKLKGFKVKGLFRVETPTQEVILTLEEATIAEAIRDQAELNESKEETIKEFKVDLAKEFKVEIIKLYKEASIKQSKEDSVKVELPKEFREETLKESKARDKELFKVKEALIQEEATFLKDTMPKVELKVQIFNKELSTKVSDFKDKVEMFKVKGEMFIAKED